MSKESGGVDSPELDVQQAEPAAQSESQPAGGSRTMTLEEVDAYTKARIDKQNSKHAKETEELTGRLADAEAAKEEAEAKVAELERERNLREWADEAAREFNVPASVIRGETLDEMREHASQIRSCMPSYPTTPGDKGEQTTPAITKEEIYAIKDRGRRVQAMAEHPELFR